VEIAFMFTLLHNDKCANYKMLFNSCVKMKMYLSPQLTYQPHSLQKRERVPLVAHLLLFSSKNKDSAEVSNDDKDAPNKPGDPSLVYSAFNNVS